MLSKVVKKLLKKYDAIDGKVKDVLSFVSNLIAVVTFTSGAAAVFVEILTKFGGKKVWAVFPWIMCLIFIAIIMGMRHQLVKYKRSMWRRLESDAGGYCGTLVKFAEYYFDVLRYRKEGKLNLELLTQVTITYLRGLLDKACDIYESYTGSKMNACIKVFGKQNEDVGFDTIDFESATVYTLVRSGNLSPAREVACDDKPVSLKGNTDFCLILDPPPFYRRNYLYQQNLQEFDKYLQSHDRKYENTTENYWNYYRGTLIVPIRMSHSHLHFTERNKEDEDHVLGFLCIDTMSTEAFISEFEDAFVQIARSFAALTYLVLNKYHYYLKRCTQIKRWREK